MPKTPPGDARQKPKAQKPEKAERQHRLAQALRENLRRRKAQARAQAGDKKSKP